VGVLNAARFDDIELTRRRRCAGGPRVGTDTTGSWRSATRWRQGWTTPAAPRSRRYESASPPTPPPTACCSGHPAGPRSAGSWLWPPGTRPASTCRSAKGPAGDEADSAVGVRAS